MDLAQYALPAAGVLVLLIGAACLLGAKALWGGKPDNWPDLIADDLLTHKVALGLFIVGASLVSAALAALLNLPNAREATAITILLFVAGGFLGNYKLFGDLRPVHTGTNTVIAAIVLGLLWLA